MSRAKESPGAALLAAWNRLSAFPGGGRLFSWYVGRMAPYTGSIGALVRDLRPGAATVVLRDRRRLRNHLRSVHAVALANLGELSTGLATTTAMSPGVRGIPVRLSITYGKKARGSITATCQTSPPALVPEPCDHVAVAELTDEAGDVVATLEATWRLGPA